VLEQIFREIDIRCDPRDIPEAIDVDVSNLGVHDVLHVSDIKVDDRIEILASPDTVIATVGIVKEEVAPTPVIEGETPAEPELISKGKKDEEEGGE
jgi:large subunit ribosomal protein L25